MLRNKKIRLATEEDCTAVLQIYAPFVTQTVITFEYKIPEPEEFCQRMKTTQQKYPWLVCEINGNIVGYAYASHFNEREAYSWSATCSVYVHPQYHGKKIGKALYSALFEILKMQGYYNVYAVVTMPNLKSETIHESFGFETVGVFEKAGYKLGSWHDVKWYRLTLKDHAHDPVKPKLSDEISDTEELAKIFVKAETRIAD